jgi:Flp pilus assembly secretin CpaC
MSLSSANEAAPMGREDTFLVSISPLARIAAVLIMAGAAPVSASGAEAITVVLDQSSIARLPESATTIVVGNPLIADVSVQSSGTMVVTGKGYGVTNLIALDRAGRVVVERLVLVRSAADTVTVYRGVARETYSCAPDCERRITLGDNPDFFDPTLAQTYNRNSRALSAGSTSPR